MKLIPAELINELKSFDGFNEAAFIDAHREENRITSVRLNPFKKTPLDFELEHQVKWCSTGFYLKNRPSFTYDPLFHAGCYYVQEAGSMFIEHALKSTLDFSEPQKILDLCAAPGGKSTLINSLLNAESLLVSNEVVKQRADVLAQNLTKWGTANAIVTNNDPQKFAHIVNFFDAVVVDAPCSGSGLFRKQPEAIDEWSPDSVNLCSARQKRIVADILPSLAQNGILVYSTCSYSAAENEEVVKWLINEFNLEYVKLQVPAGWGITETEFGYRFYPHLTMSEGFFCAVLRKTQGEPGITKPIKRKETKVSKNELQTLEPFIGHTSLQIQKIGECYHLINTAVADFMAYTSGPLYLKKAGTRLGEIKGRDFVPNHELALSINNYYPVKLELDYNESLRFLKKEAFLPQNPSPGLALVNYKGLGLSWAKILQNRMNNYLPNELRILN